MHADHAADIDLTGAGEAIVAHHAHHRAGNNAEVLFQRRPALNSTDAHVGFAHPTVDHSSQLGHLEQGCGRNVLGRNVLANALQLGGGAQIVVLHAVNAPENLGEVDGFHGDAVGFEDLL